MSDEKALTAFLAELRAGSNVLFLGPAGRTWKEDVALLEGFVGMVLGEGGQVLHASIGPFSTWVDRAVVESGYESITCDPEPLEVPKAAKGKGVPKGKQPVLGCSADLLEMSDLRIVFPLENAPPVSAGMRILKPSPATQVKYTPTTADHALLLAPPRPTLAVYRYFPWEFTSC